MKVSILSYICILLLSSLFFSCSLDEQQKIGDIKSISPIKSSTKIDILQYVDSLEYIILENSNNALLAWVDKLVVTEKSFILKCRNRSAVFIYNQKGAFINKIAVAGKGPLSFSNVQDIAANDSFLFISDFDQKKIVQYDLNSHKVINEYRNGASPYYTLLNEDNIIHSISNDFENGKIEIIDIEKGSLLSQSVKNPLYLNFIVTPYCIRNIEDTIYYGMSFTDTIYKSINRNIIPFAIIENEQGPLSDIITKEYVDEYLYNYRSKNETDKDLLIPRGFLFIHKNLFFIELVWENLMIIWDRFKEKSYLIDFSNFINKDVLFGYQLFKLYDIDKKGFCYSSIIPSEPFFANAEKLVKSQEIEPNLRNTLQNIVNRKNEILASENPIIIKFKLRTSFFNDL